MQIERKQNTITLLLAIFLTLGITIIKAGALEWVSFTWVSLCSLLLASIVLRGKLLPISKNTLSTQFTIFAPAIFFISFQLWGLIQTFLIAEDQTASLNSCINGFGFALLLNVWLYVIRHKKAFDWLYLSIISFVILQTVYGLWIFISNTNLLLWMPKLYYLDRPTGFFVNANHFAAYLVLSIILISSKTLVDLGSKRPSAKHNNNSTIFSAVDALYSPKLIALGLLIVALITTKSIGALTAICVVIGAFSINFIRKSPYRFRLSLIIISLIVIFLIGILSLDYSLIEEELLGLTHTFARRYELSKAAFVMLQDNWLTGIGGGSFYSQFSQYRNLEIGNSYYNYAHNDLIQFWIEYGVIGVTILTLFLCCIVRDNLKILQTRSSNMQKTFAYAAIYSIIAVLLHSLVDFPLHIPGFSILFLIIISLNSLYKMNTVLFTDVYNKKV